MACDPRSWNITVGLLYEENFRSFINSKQRSAKDLHAFEALSRFHKAYYGKMSSQYRYKSLEIEWSAPVDKLSLRNFHVWDDKTEDRSSSYTLNQIGYAAVLDELAKNLPPIHLNSKISLIDYSDSKIKLKLIDGHFHPTEYDYLISTIP